MANKGSVSCTATISAVFGNGEGPRDIVIQNVGTANVFVHWDTAEVDKGVRIAPGESVCTSQLPHIWRGKLQDGLTAICDTGDTTTILWSA